MASLTGWRPLAGMLLACPAVLAGPGTVGVRAQTVLGHVYDGATGSPLAGAEIAVANAAGERLAGAASDGAGRFLVRVPGTGRYALTAMALGYRPSEIMVEVGAGETIRVELRMRPAPFEIDSITATARPRIRYLEDSGFYRREERGWGSFYDRPKLERLPAAFPRQLLRQLRGVSTTPDGSIRMGSCSPAIILDGMHMGDVILDDVVDPATIQGIEVYDSPNTIPIEFRRGRTCGAVLVWTQSRP